MDPIKIEKIQALNKYKRARFIYKILHFTIIAFAIRQFFPSPIWVLSLCSSIKLFFLVSLPKMGAFFVGPKCLFILFNVIVVILVGESKFVSSSSSPKPDIYEEYVERTRSNLKEREKITEKFVIGKKLRVKEEIERKEERMEEDEKEEEIEKEKVFEDFEIEEESGLPADELNKRVEDFIAKVNQQRRSEAKLMVSSG